MNLISSDTKSALNSSSDYEEDDDVFSKLSRFDLITFSQDLMGCCQEKYRHMRVVKKHYDLIKYKLKFYKDKVHDLDRDYNALVNHMCDKPPDEKEMTLREFIIIGYDRTKLASMIYSVGKSK